MGDDLEERLRNHARAFEGLMSLIPAERYYEKKDTSEEYKKKKQTPEERRAARLAKLNPENHKSAKDVMDENERKRKRELEAETQDDISENGNTEKPGEGMKLPTQKRTKVDKNDAQKSSKVSKESTEQKAPTTNGEKSDEQRNAEKAQKRKEKEAAKKEKIARKEEKRAAKQAAKKASKDIQEKEESQTSDHDEAEQDTSMMMPTDDLDAVDVSGLVDEDEDDDKSPSPERDSIFSNNSAQPSASSTSSVETAPAELLEVHPNKIQLPPVDKLELQARLQAKIEALRAARKADGPDGRPAKNRAELIEARRKKAEQKKIAKKEARAKARDADNDEAAKERTEAELARLRGSGSPLGSDIFSPSIPRSPDTNFNFGRVAFTDGQKLDSNLSYFTNPHHASTKGPSDTKTALAMAQRKQARLNGLDSAKRADIEEKDMWLNAKKKAQGERVVKDDVSLLKKTLKRSDKEKKKSASEWTNRIDGVAKGIEMRQKKREENLQKRRDERGGGGKKKAAVSKKRPGFEGGFRSKPGK